MVSNAESKNVKTESSAAKNFVKAVMLKDSKLGEDALGELISKKLENRIRNVISKENAGDSSK